MQPKRDPSDRRYWPTRSGGTGTGFTGRNRADSPYHYGAISRRGHLTKLSTIQDTSSMDDATAKATRMAVRQAARLASLRLLDRLSAEAHTMDTGTAVQALGQAGKLADTVRPAAQAGQTINIGTLHLDALRAPNYHITASKMPENGALEAQTITFGALGGGSNAPAISAQSAQTDIHDTVDAQVIDEVDDDNSFNGQGIG